MKNYVKLILTLLVITPCAFAQESVTQLQENYSGNVSWEESSGTLTFLSTGTINFPWKKGTKEQAQSNLENWLKHNFWSVPKTVKKIVIEENVTVTGAFWFNGTCAIEGKNRETSVVYGTDISGWTEGGNEYGTDPNEWKYCQFQNEGKGGTLTIENLTSKNPFAYHIRACNVKAFVKNCNFIDNRGGHSNHSDGFLGGDGSLVENCYFETGDDIFKVYFDYTVRNCTVNMVQNTVPIQLGWGSYSNNAVGTFENLTITGNSGRGSDSNAIIAGSYNGSYNVTVNINGIKVKNPNASWVSLQGSTKVNGTVQNADISIGRFWSVRNSGTCNMLICNVQTGASTTQKVFKCNGVDPEPTEEFITLEAESKSDWSGTNLKSDTYCTPHIGGISDGYWLKYSNFDFEKGCDKFIVYATSGYDRPGSSIEVRLDSPDGPLAGQTAISKTAGWCDYQEFSGNLTGANGVHDLYIVAKVDESQPEKNDIFDIDWFKFRKSASPSAMNNYEIQKIKIFPNPASEYFFIQSENIMLPYNLDLTTLDGRTIFSELISEENSKINLENLNYKGMLVVKVIAGNHSFADKIIIM